MSTHHKKPHLIRVHIIEARGLQGMDESFMSDALTQVMVGPTTRIRRETDTKERTVNALWDMTFTFENVMLTDDEFAREKITIRTLDRNDFLSNALIGEHEFSLTNIHRQKGHEYFRKWVPLYLPNDPGEERGYVLLSVFCLKEGDETPNHDDEAYETTETLDDPDPKVLGVSKPYILNVLVYKAQGLLPTQTFRGNLNPFVSVRFNGNTLQTKRMSNLTAPIWNSKFEMPFMMPLSSDAVEVQVWNDQRIWNDLRTSPDILIGQHVFSYYQLRLTHKPWGPKWVNLYSSKYIPPETSRLGSWMDSLQGADESAAETEYVGRILVRLSVEPVVYGLSHRLSKSPCNPTTEPPADEYSLQLLLYRGSEIPVLGGKCRVEVCFGSQRYASKWVMGKDGAFNWGERMQMLNLYCPKDLEQIHDVFINLYHQTGISSRKICYERISVQDLLPDKNHFYINGDLKAHHEWSTWKPKWRSFKHVFPDPKKSHVIAGFLLCSVGFGLRKHVPPRVPQMMSYQPLLYTLRVRVHQAANLPPGNDNGSADPFVVIRFGGHSARLPTKRDTLFPFWYEQRELDVPVDRRHPPSVFFMVYSEGSLGNHTLLGRSEVLAEDVFLEENQGRLLRFPLYSEEHPVHTLSDLQEFDRTLQGGVPYVLASFSVGLAHNSEHLKQEWVNNIPEAKAFSVKIETLGFRNASGSKDWLWQPLSERIRKPLSRRLRKPLLQMDYPAFDPESQEPPRVFSDIDKPVAESINFVENITLPQVPLPANNLHGVPLRIRLYDHTMTGGKVLVGSVQVPIGRFIKGEIESPSFYVYKVPEPERQNASESEEDMTEEESEESEVEGDLAGKNEDTFNITLDLNEEGQNVTTLTQNEFVGTGARNMREIQRTSELKREDQVQGEIEGRPEYQDMGPQTYYELELQKGASRAFYGGSLENHNKRFGEIAAVMKAFIRVAPSKHDSLLQSDDMLEPIKEMYQKDYIVRIYVYKGVNITARKHWKLKSLIQSGDRQVSNPYLQIANGPDDNHIFSDRANYQEDNVNPEFYQVVELPAVLPDNNNLEISCWDRHDITGDELIGVSNLDLEWRLLHGLSRGEMEYRMLRKPGSDISNGKVLCKVHILTVDEARREKPEDLRPPQPQNYELRMVLWITRDVRMPEEKNRNNDVNQKIFVTTNFDGTFGEDNIKETDVAWDSSGEAEWNWRFVFPIQFPCKVPRLKIALWDYNSFLMDVETSIGEVNYNLKPFFDKVLREKQAITHQDQKWVSFKHPNFAGVKLGEINVEFWLYTQIAAEQDPVGEAQDEPNHDPYLAPPKRKLPPWAVGSKGLGWLAKRRKLVIFLCAFLILGSVVIPVILSQAGTAVF